MVTREDGVWTTGPQRAAGGTAPSDALGRLLADGIAPKERLRAFRNLGESLWRQHPDVTGLADRGAEALAEGMSRLPIRDADTLAARYGADVEAAAGRLVDEAARLAGWVWTAAAAIPAPARAVHLITVLVHSAVEIRLIAELYVLYGGPGPRDAGWLGTVVNAWAAGRPVAAAPSAVVSTRDIVVKLRQAVAAPPDRNGRLARLRHRGRDEAAAVRRLGWRFCRRMRPHPSTWPSPAREPVGADAVRVVGDLLRGGPGTPPESPAGPPSRYLIQAWTHHLQARAAADAARDADPAVLARLDGALAQQEAHLRWLGGKLRLSPPPAPGAEPTSDGTDPLRWAHTCAGMAEDAVDLTEEAGLRSRRLGGWPVRVRNGLTYAATTLALAVPVGLLAAGGLHGTALPVRIAVFTLSVAALAAVAFGFGTVLIGLLFRPWLGGRVARSPVTGLVITTTIAILAIAAAAAVPA